MTPDDAKKIAEIHEKIYQPVMSALQEYKPNLVLTAFESLFTQLFWSYWSIDEYQTLLKKMREDAPRAYGFYNDAIKRRMN